MTRALAAAAILLAGATAFAEDAAQPATGTARWTAELTPPKSTPPFANLVPSIHAGKVLIADGRSIASYDLATGERRWQQVIWAGTDKNAHVCHRVAVAGGRAYASFIHRVARPEFYRGIPIKEEIPFRRLVAIDLETGEPCWSPTGSADPFLSNERLSIPLAPVVRDGVLFAGANLSEGMEKSYVVALDAATGALRWKRFIGAGQVELTMFGEAAFEPVAMPPGESGGTVYYASGHGHFAALAAASGEVRWTTAYDSIPVEAARTYYATERVLAWSSAPPLVAEGVVVVAPIDSVSAHGLDAATGKRLWSLPHGSLRHFAGIESGRAVFHGDRVTTVDLRSGKVEVDAALVNEGSKDREVGRGAISEGVLYVPFAVRIARIDVRTGVALPNLNLPEGLRQSGSVVASEGVFLTANPQRLNVFGARAPTPAKPPEVGK